MKKNGPPKSSNATIMRKTEGDNLDSSSVIEKDPANL